MSDSLSPRGLRHARPLCPSPSFGIFSSSCRWYYLTISSSAALFSCCLQSFPTSGSFAMSQLFISGGQRIGALASASVLPMNIPGWFHFGLTGLISLLSKGLSRVFSSTTIQNCQFFSTQASLWSNSHIHTWLLEKPYLWHHFVGKVMSLLFNTLFRLVKAFLPRAVQFRCSVISDS